MGLSLFKFVQWAPKGRVRFGRSRTFTVIQGMILVPIESAYATSY